MAAINLPPHFAHKIGIKCTDKKCLEDTYGPNAVNMIIAMFTMAGLDLPPHLAHLAEATKNTKPANDEPHIVQTKIDESCNDKKCLEDTKLMRIELSNREWPF